MKVLHLSASPGGGAGTAALRLHQGLRRIGVESDFLSLDTSDGSERIHRVEPSRLRALGETLGRLGLPLTTLARNRLQLRFRRGEYESFSFPRADVELESHPLVRAADVINLHWVGGLVDYRSFFSRVRKPLVWTLHDMNPFSGGFHYEEDAQRNQASLGSLDRALRARKARWLQAAPRLCVVGPSQWITRASASSEALCTRLHHCIPYGLDTEVFRPYPRALCRAVFGLRDDERVLLCVSSSVSNRRKGVDLLRAAFASCKPASTRVVIAGIGELSDPGFIGTGHVGDVRLMAQLMSAADLVVVPSREDNLPNVVLEALACGTPVVGFAVGGIPDAVTADDGVLAARVDAGALAAALALGLERLTTFDRERIRQRAVERFGLTVQAERYRELYRALLSP